jgi:hypothetical protein
VFNMNWLPTFANWPLAALAAGLAVPSLVLLYFLKLRRKEASVPSTILWKKAVQDLQVNSPFQKLRRNLLLLLQLLALIALLLALSNPITFYKARAGDRTVILIDRSASMSARDGNGVGGGRTRLDEAKRRALDLVDTMGRGGRAMVIAFDDSAETMQPFTGDAPALRNAINAIRPTDRRSSLKLAYQLADAQVQVVEGPGNNNQNQQRVFVYSDGRTRDDVQLALRGDVTFEPVGDPQSRNVAVVSFSARRNYEQPTQVQVFARLANYGPEPVAADVTLSVAAIDPQQTADAFEVRQVRSGLRLLPDRWSDKQKSDAEAKGEGNRNSVEFTLDIATAATIKLEQTNKDRDVLPQDDAALVVVPPPKSLAVALVTDFNPFLERMLASQRLQKPATLTPSDWETARPADYDVVIFDRYVPKHRPESGNYIWVGALPEDLALSQRKDEQGRGMMSTDVGVMDWAREHPIMRNLPSMDKLFIAEAMQLSLPLDATTLLDGTAGPLVVLHRQGKSTHLALAFDSLQSNWPMRKSFSLFFYYALQYIAVGTDLTVRESFAPGSTPRLPRSNLERALNGAKEITLVGPAGPRKLAVPATGDFALPPLDAVGLYQTNPVVPQYERVAVNLLDETESNVLPLDKPPGSIGQIAQADNGRSPLQLWWWLLAAVGLPLLLIEWWVYTRRVHA